MFEKVSCESVGIKSSNVIEFLEYLKSKDFNMHSVIIARGDKICSESYWAPFNKDNLHRMYSQTKSFVGIAICQLIADSYLGIDDKIIDYFEDKRPENIHPYFKEQTIGDMLKMRTCISKPYSWFGCGVTDRCRHYFSCMPTHKSDTSFYYDSEASYILGCLVERITGKNFLDYLREKCLDKIGFSHEAHVLYAPEGYAWGDSALLCRPIDMVLFARLIANGGEWNGEQLLNHEWVKKATSFHTKTGAFGTQLCGEYGYGYQIWKTAFNSFAFRGMHCQHTIYNPQTDIIFSCTAGNKAGDATNIIFDAFFKYIVNGAENTALAESEDAERLKAYSKNLELNYAKGSVLSSIKEKVNNKTFVFEKNPMNISRLKLTFKEDECILNYRNSQGEKNLVCGLGKNVFSLFPQTGYSKEIGAIGCEGNMYKCACSACWETENTLYIKVQIIDDYIGVLDMRFNFCDDIVLVKMFKDAEDFLNEYCGEAKGHIAD